MKKISAIILAVIMLTVIVFTMSSCGDDGSDGKQIPVYTGMSISSAEVSLTSYNGNVNNGNGNNGDNGNHYGHYKGDYNGKDDDLDEENPFPENSENENIEEELKGSLNVVGAAQEIYYAHPNEKIFITIHIDNPDNFEIMSFTLNGKKYTNYMFEDGSDMENIILEYDVGDAHGVVEYTIDAIKYIDGTEIKDVLIEGNKTVKAGIKTNNQVSAQISNLKVEFNKISFKANVKDNDGLVAFSNGKVICGIYDGAKLVAIKELSVGENEVVFEGLTTNALYQFGIIGYYNDLSGNGMVTKLLCIDATYTNAVVLFDDITVGKEEVSFSFKWHNDHANKVLTTLKLYKGDTLVETLDIADTSIDGLLSANEYKLVAEYVNGTETESIVLDFTTQAKATPDVVILEPAKTQTSIGFTLTETDDDNIGTIIKMELLHGDDTPIVVENLDVREFTNLLSNNTYTVKVTYVYDLNDGAGEQTITKTMDITTDAKATPDVVVSDPVKTQTSLGFVITETDTDNIGAITKIELLHGEDEPVVADTLDVREFTNLLSNNTYTVRVTYVYDLNDGNGEQTITKTLDITTEAKAAPIFTFGAFDIDRNTVAGEYSVTDVDGVLASYKVEIYKGETLVAENEDKEIDFADLEYYKEYTVKITYTYDLNDGNGEQTSVAEKKGTTIPYIDIKSFSVINTSAVSEGDTIFMRATLDNPAGMKIKYAIINGERYNVAASSTATMIFIEVVYNGQFDGGDTLLEIEKVVGELDGVEYTAESETVLSDNVFINGKIELISVEFVNEAFEPIEWSFKSETVYVLITLDNPTGYSIDKLIGKAQNYIPTKIDDNRWCVAFSQGNFVELESIYYSNEYIQKEYKHGYVMVDYRRLESDEIVYIETPEDLLNMSNNYYYELKNDIDLEGIEWHGNSINGVFDGKGYSIKNMSFVGSLHNQNAYIGLFSSSNNGYIKNLNMENILVIASLTSDDGGAYRITYGSILATGSRGVKIENCTVDEDSLVNVKGIAGGIVGRGGTIVNCVNNGTICGIDNVGGIYGGYYVDNNYTVAINCINNGSVSGGFAVGGIGGYLGTVKNCINAGEVTGTGTSVGGVCGLSEKTENSINIGDVNGVSGCVGGICGGGTAKNSYTLNSYIDNEETCTADQLNSKEFYTETLGWSEEIWDLSDLDFENGKYPVLK